MRLLFTLGLSVGLLPLGAAEISYEKDVKPILETHCYECHGASQQIANLRLDRKELATVAGPLNEAGMSATDPVYLRGAEFLLRSQAPDGSWPVRSRAEPVQIYFDAGYPYDTDQWISAAGASWAMTALALTQPAKH